MFHLEAVFLEFPVINVEVELFVEPAIDEQSLNGQW